MEDPEFCEFLKNIDNKTHEECYEFVKQLEKQLATESHPYRARCKYAKLIYTKLHTDAQREKFLKALWDYEIWDNAYSPNRQGSCLARPFMNFVLLYANPQLRSLKTFQTPDDLLTIHVPNCLRRVCHHIRYDTESNKYHYSLQADPVCPLEVGSLHLGQLEYFVMFLGNFLGYPPEDALTYAMQVKATVKNNQRSIMIQKTISEQLSGSFDKYQLLASYTRHSFFSRVKYRIFNKERSLQEVVMMLSERASDHAGASRKVCEEFNISFIMNPR